MELKTTGLEYGEIDGRRTGVVVDCFRLNVRKEATIASDVVDVIPANGRIIIDMDNSAPEWYAVLLDNGKRGFCMKQFVKLEN